MSTEQNKALAHRLIEEILNQRNMSVIDEIFSPDFVENEELPPGVPPGREAPRALFGMLHSAFPDFKATIKQIIAEGDKVVLYMTWTGTQEGELLGIPPTGKRVSFDVIDIVGIADGKLVEHWGIMDSAKMMQQLGAVPG
ncbi:ester cyclase [Aggregatilinea lenta]|uniref:ester cyclase n=1 Tax=Aggregatilinea lenta TaxID=913108 RepID=UPI000E5BAF79|nr:ester cyclase [Aggregatilinea lenta]